MFAKYSSLDIDRITQSAAESVKIVVMNEIKLTFSPITYELCAATAELISICFPDMPASEQYDAADFEEMVEVYPMGTVVVLDGEKVVGMGTGIFTDIDFDNLPAREIGLLYGDDDESLHDDDGDYYWGSDIAVHPDYRGMGIAREIYRWRKAQVTDNGKKGFAAAAVLPGYADHRDKLTIHDYVDKVIAKELFDPTLSVQIRNGFRVVKLLHEFFIFPRSDNWSALIFWENPEL